MIVYRHTDGGHYVIATQYPVQMKMEDGAWEPAVFYRRVERGPTGRWQYEGQNHFCTTQKRWDERFTKVQPCE